jgi:hypothetical protein
MNELVKRKAGERYLTASKVSAEDQCAKPKKPVISFIDNTLVKITQGIVWIAQKGNKY